MHSSPLETYNNSINMAKDACVSIRTHVKFAIFYKRTDVDLEIINT